MYYAVWSHKTDMLVYQITTPSNNWASYAPIIVLPHYPPLGLKWGFGRGFDTKISPHHGAFDISERRPTMWGIWKPFKKSSSRQIPTQVPTSHLGFTWGFDTLGLSHYGAFDILVCQIPTIAPYKPEVGLYIDHVIK